MPNPIILTYGSTVMSFSGFPAYPTPIEWNPNQIYGKTASGKIFVYDRGGLALREHVINFDRVTDAEYNSMTNFFRQTTFGKTKFTYQDIDGNQYTVRWANIPYRFERHTVPNTWRGQLVFWEEIKP